MIAVAQAGANLAVAAVLVWLAAGSVDQARARLQEAEDLKASGDWLRRLVAEASAGLDIAFGLATAWFALIFFGCAVSGLFHLIP